MFHVPLVDYVDKRFVIRKKKCEKCRMEERFTRMYHYEDIFTLGGDSFGSIDFYGCKYCFDSKEDFFEFIQDRLPSGMPK